MNKDDITTLLTRALGLVLLMYSLLAIPQALGAIFTYGVMFYIGMPKDDTIGKLLASAQHLQLSHGVTSIFTVFILFLLSRWILRGPKILKIWMNAKSSDTPRSVPPSGSA